MACAARRACIDAFGIPKCVIADSAISIGGSAKIHTLAYILSKEVVPYFNLCTLSALCVMIPPIIHGAKIAILGNLGKNSFVATSSRKKGTSKHDEQQEYVIVK